MFSLLPALVLMGSAAAEPEYVKTQWRCLPPSGEEGDGTKKLEDKKSVCKATCDKDSTCTGYTIPNYRTWCLIHTYKVATGTHKAEDNGPGPVCFMKLGNSPPEIQKRYQDYKWMSGKCYPATTKKSEDDVGDFNFCAAKCAARVGCTAFMRPDLDVAWCKTYTTAPADIKGQAADNISCWVQKPKVVVVTTTAAAADDKSLFKSIPSAQCTSAMKVIYRLSPETCREHCLKNRKCSAFTHKTHKSLPRCFLHEKGTCTAENAEKGRSTTLTLNLLNECLEGCRLCTTDEGSCIRCWDETIPKVGDKCAIQSSFAPSQAPTPFPTFEIGPGMYALASTRDKRCDDGEKPVDNQVECNAAARALRLPLLSDATDPNGGGCCFYDPGWDQISYHTASQCPGQLKDEKKKYKRVCYATGITGGEDAWGTLFDDVQALITNKASFSDGSKDFMAHCEKFDVSYYGQMDKQRRRGSSTSACSGSCDNPARALASSIVLMMGEIFVEAGKLSSENLGPDKFSDKDVVTPDNLIKAIPKVGLTEMYAPYLKQVGPDERRRSGMYPDSKTLLGEHIFDVFQNGDLSGKMKSAKLPPKLVISKMGIDTAEELMNYGLCALTASALNIAKMGGAKEISKKYVYEAAQQFNSDLATEITALGDKYVNAEGIEWVETAGACRAVHEKTGRRNVHKGVKFHRVKSLLACQKKCAKDENCHGIAAPHHDVTWCETYPLNDAKGDTNPKFKCLMKPAYAAASSATSKKAKGHHRHRSKRLHIGSL